MVERHCRGGKSLRGPQTEAKGAAGTDHDYVGTRRPQCRPLRARQGLDLDIERQVVQHGRKAGAECHAGVGDRQELRQARTSK